VAHQVCWRRSDNKAMPMPFPKFEMSGTRLEMGYGLKRNGNAPFRLKEGTPTIDSGDSGAGRPD
jgi:hypothetical protein